MRGSSSDFLLQAPVNSCAGKAATGGLLPSVVAQSGGQGSTFRGVARAVAQKSSFPSKMEKCDI